MPVKSRETNSVLPSGRIRSAICHLLMSALLCVSSSIRSGKSIAQFACDASNRRRCLDKSAFLCQILGRVGKVSFSRMRSFDNADKNHPEDHARPCTQKPYRREYPCDNGGKDQCQDDYSNCGVDAKCHIASYSNPHAWSIILSSGERRSGCAMPSLIASLWTCSFSVSVILATLAHSRLSDQRHIVFAVLLSVAGAFRAIWLLSL